MPFTFSHPAIILPFQYLPKKWYSLTGLVTGSIAPDFEKFFRMKLVNSYSHTLSSLFWFSLPLALFLSFTFHLIVRNPLINHLPFLFRKRLTKYLAFNWKNHFKNFYFVTILSIIIGAASHLFWDAFTHQHGKFVQEFPILRSEVSFFFFQAPFYKMADRVSSILGGLVIIYNFYKVPIQETPLIQQKTLVKYWCTFGLITWVIVFFRFYEGPYPPKFWDILITFISGSFLSSLISPLILKAANS